jgi:hypothetical protein
MVPGEELAGAVLVEQTGLQKEAHDLVDGRASQRRRSFGTVKT